MNVPLNIDWQQILLHMFNFVLLFAILYFLLYKPVKNFMAKRTEYYRQMDEEAKAKAEQAAALQKEAEARLAKIDTEIAEKRQAAENALHAEEEKELAETHAKCEKMLREAEKESQTLHDDYLRQAENDLEEMIDAAAERIVYQDNNAAFEGFLNTVEDEKEHEEG